MNEIGHQRNRTLQFLKLAEENHDFFSHSRLYNRWVVLASGQTNTIAGKTIFAAPVEYNRDRIIASPIPMCRRNRLHRGRLLFRRHSRDGL